MRPTVRCVLIALLALYLFSCQGHGRVHEAPPPSYPSPSSSHPPVETQDRFATPPARSPSDGDVVPPPSEPLVPESRPAPSTSAERSRPARGFDDEGWGMGGPARKSAPSSDRLHARRNRDERPGLATHWGETRYSPAREVDFERAESERPAALLELHYNDRDGALDMLPRGSWGRSTVDALAGAIEISMVDASGRAFSALRQGDRVVAMGDPGERYSLFIQNRSAERFEVVATVDGLDVLDGEDGSLAKRGYLVHAHSSVVIDGFRQSSAEVAAFRLGDVARSYAASKGKARNVGVIGIALFDERRPVVHRPYPPAPWREDDTYRRRTADPFPGRYARPPSW
jgi:hypothetical protein